MQPQTPIHIEENSNDCVQRFEEISSLLPPKAFFAPSVGQIEAQNEEIPCIFPVIRELVRGERFAADCGLGS